MKTAAASLRLRDERIQQGVGDRHARSVNANVRVNDWSNRGLLCRMFQRGGK